MNTPLLEEEISFSNRPYYRLVSYVLFGIALFFATCALSPGCKTEKERNQKKVIKRGAQFGKARTRLLEIPLTGKLAEVDSAIKWHPVNVIHTQKIDTFITPAPPPTYITIDCDTVKKKNGQSIVSIKCPDCPPQKVITIRDSTTIESTARLDSAYTEMQIAELDHKAALAAKDKTIGNLTKQNVSNHNGLVKWRKRTLWTWIPLAIIFGGALAIKIFKPKIPFLTS